MLALVVALTLELPHESATILVLTIPLVVVLRIALKADVTPLLEEVEAEAVKAAIAAGGLSRPFCSKLANNLLVSG